MIKTSDTVPCGMPAISSCGDVSAPSHEYSIGMASPSANAGEESSMLGISVGGDVVGGEAAPDAVSSVDAEQAARIRIAPSANESCLPMGLPILDVRSWHQPTLRDAAMHGNAFRQKLMLPNFLSNL